MSDDERKENQLEDIACEMSADLAAEKRAEEWQQALDEERLNNEKIISTVRGLFPFP